MCSEVIQGLWFHSAAEGDLRRLEYLLNRCASTCLSLLDLRDENGRTAMMNAALYGHTTCVESLLRHGANHSTALVCASYGGHYGCMKSLLRWGSDPNICDWNGWTALIVSARIGRFDCLSLLLDYGAMVNLQCKNGMTALMEATSVATLPYFLMIDSFFRYKQALSVDPTEYPVFQPLKSIKALLDAGASVQIQQNDGSTVMDRADNALLKCMLTITLFKGELLRTAWRRGCVMEDSNDPMMRTILRQRIFEEELIQIVWRPTGRMMTYFVEVDDEC